MKINDKIVTDENDILTALRQEFEGGTEFVILENGDNFIQTASGDLEYSADGKNYRVADSPVEPEKIEAAFLSFYRGDGEYLRNFPWQEIVFESLWTQIKNLFKK